MGKRKYETETAQSDKKKAKTVESVEEEKVESEQPQNEPGSYKQEKISSKRGGFDVKHFRKELAAKQGQTMVLTQFLQVCLNPDNSTDYILEYLKGGGNSHEILRQITQDSKKNLTLATPAFHIFHLIILKVQSSLPHMIAITEEACRYFLNTFMPTVEIMISENSGPRHRKIVLKLLTSMVTLNSDLGIEVLNQAPLTPKHLQHVVEKPNFKEKDNVRTSFVHFMTSFLVDGHLPLIKALLEKQGLLGLVIPGLISDEPEATLIFLNILKKNVVNNALISKSLKLKTFSHQVLHNLFKVFSWKGPPELSQEAKSVARPEIMAILSDIIITLFTSHRLGLYFVDKSLGTVDANKNQNLYKALLTLKRPWENEYECDVILNIMFKCPDLHRALFNVIEHSFEPQHSPIWERTTDFTVKLLNKLKPEEMVPRMSNLNPIQVANFVRFTTLPVPLLKFINLNLGKDQTISLYCVKVLVKMLQSLRRYLQILEINDTQSTDLRNKLEYFIPKHLPLPTTIVTLIDNVIFSKTDEESTKDYRLPKMNDTDALTSLVDLLLLYNDINPVYFETLEGNIDMKKILDFSNSLTAGHVALLKFKVVSLWLTLDNSAVSLKNSMFKDLFLIMLDVYMSDEDDTWIEAKDTLRVFFKNTSVFEGDEDEIHLILYTLRYSKVNPPSLIGEIVQYVLENIQELTDYVRNQLVNFEISWEHSEDNLKKLFNDLMEDRNTEDSVFLESKLPSPFIVGCIQYLQKHKDVKKNLKHFLSLYIANLLHSNYSPELTEVLIGDCKLDARNYVASWMSEPTFLPDSIIGEDDILNGMSKSIIGSAEISLEDVFPMLQKVTEGGDVKINNVLYKIDIATNIDSSELLIWAKYLIFCTIRLTNMSQLSEEQQKRITDYFQCLIAIGKKHLRMDVCRTIILALFKNAHFLKIYKLIPGKTTASLHATEFLLEVITHQKDIIEYLNNKHKLLKSYQQKNYNEILKAFIKINKRKNVDSDYTIKVLQVIGVSNEDDVKIFNLIFSAETDSYLKDDKEPSLVIELLRYLIEKYSETVMLELQPNVLKKVINLYTNLLSNKDINPNLTSLENALMTYFENKPHQVSKVLEEDFKKFFYVKVLRKSTANLASVLLKFNVKFCTIFKDEITRPEILSQRELTLPLGNAIICHNQFLLDNKELLPTIFKEYKSSIIKLLEKPHKAGQIYTSCWWFIRKLVLECMEIEDGVKLFNKSHKFEAVEVSHVQLLKSLFLKLCAKGNSVKKEHLINYFLSMIHLAIMAFKEDKTEALNVIVISTHTVVQVSKIVEGLDTDQRQEFTKIFESGIWQNFCKATLKDSLKVRTVGQSNTMGPKLLALLTELVKLFYPEDHDDISTLFDMVTSHSEFLNVMLSHHSSDIKSRLIEFLYTLILRNKSVMKTPQIPVYLSAYHATRTPCDRLIVSILHYYETNGLPVNEYKPYVFGDSAANFYAVRKNRTSSLWSHPTPNQVLNLFDKEVIERTVRNFPVTQKFDYYYVLNSNIGVASEVKDSVRSLLDEMLNHGVLKPHVSKDSEGIVKDLLVKGKYEHVAIKFKNVDLLGVTHMDEDEGIYDPMFLFPLLSHLLAPGSVASCFKMLRSGLLSVPVMALSSHCPTMRAAAYHVLHRFCMLLETETRHKNDKLFLTDFINTLRQSLTTAINNSDELENKGVKNPRLPALDALYLARALLVSTAPFDPLYKPVNNFLIAKQFVDLTLVPDFLSLFHDSDVESAERRLWILEVIKDGTKTMTDINVVFKTMCLKMIMDFYSSVLSERRTKEKTLSLLSSIVAIPRAFEILVEGHGLISWLHAVVRQTNDRTLIKGIFVLIQNMIYSTMVSAFSRNVSAKNGKVDHFIELRTNKDVEQEVLVIHYDLLKHINDLELEDVMDYVKVYRLVSKRAIKSLSKKQMLSLVNKIGAILKDCEVIRLLAKALLSNDCVVLKSRNVDINIGSEIKANLIHCLTDVIQSYVG